MNPFRRVVPVFMKHPSSNFISTRGAAVIDQISCSLVPGDSRTYSEPSGIHSPLRVKRLPDCPAGLMLSIGHYFESRTGTRRVDIPYPEILFINQGTTRWIPLSMRTPFSTIVTASVDNGNVVILDPSEHARLIGVVNIWMAAVQANILRERKAESIVRPDAKVIQQPAYLAL